MLRSTRRAGRLPPGYSTLQHLIQTNGARGLAPSDLAAVANDGSMPAPIRRQAYAELARRESMRGA